MTAMGMGNVYFDLTEELNAEGPIAVLASGQAVVFYKVSIMSKDGDWILRETPDACRRALAVLGRHGACYRLRSPLHPRGVRALGPVARGARIPRGSRLSRSGDRALTSL